MMDHRTVSKTDLSSQFLLAKDSVGMNRAAASLSRAQLLNPMVDVVASSASPDDKNDLYYEQFTVICAIGCTKTQINRLNRIARQCDIKFFAADVFGFSSYIFVDLGKNHNYSREVVTPATKDKPEFTRVVNDSATFCPFQEVLDMNWKNASAGFLRKSKPAIHVILVLLEFLEKFKRPPTPGSSNDITEFHNLLDAYLTNNGLSKDLILPTLTSNISGQLGPVCAITGGVLAQEIVKAISQKDEPISNVFVFDPVLGTGIVEKFSRADTPGVYIS